jgi:hypothetical protein
MPAPMKIDSPERWSVYFAAPAVFYVYCFAATNPFSIDEAYTANLASDPSIAHMLSALKAGADGSLPLYAILVFLWGKVFGTSEFSLRLTSGVFFILFVWHSSRRLARHFTLFASALAILFVAANRNFNTYVTEARFYGLLVFTFSLAFWSTWDLIEIKAVSRRLWIGHLLANGLLWLSHPLGAVYGSILAALYGCFSLYRKTFSFGNALAFCGGPLLFLPWLPSFLTQSRIKPTFTLVLEFPEWDWMKMFLSYAILESRALGAGIILGIVILILLKWKCIHRAHSKSCLPLGGVEKPVPVTLLLYAMAFLALLNLALGFLDATGAIPVFAMTAIRYYLIAAVGYGVILAAALEALDRIVCCFVKGPWLKTIRYLQSGALTLLISISLYRLWSTSSEDTSKREQYLTRVAEVAGQKDLEVFCESHWDAFFLKVRTPTKDIKYVVRARDPFRVLFLQMARYYPQPVPTTWTELVDHPRDYVFVAAQSSDLSEAAILKRGKIRGDVPE